MSFNRNVVSCAVKRNPASLKKKLIGSAVAYELVRAIRRDCEVNLRMNARLVLRVPDRSVRLLTYRWAAADSVRGQVCELTH